MNHEELVKALRYCGNFAEREGCAESCEYFNDMDCPNRIMSDAAAAIEELQQIADHYEQTAKDYWKEACEYKAQLPKRGEWVRKEGELTYWYECSECGYRPHIENYPYLSDFCPNCGARMDGGKDDLR